MVALQQKSTMLKWKMLLKMEKGGYILTSEKCVLTSEDIISSVKYYGTALKMLEKKTANRSIDDQEVDPQACTQTVPSAALRKPYLN